MEIEDGGMERWEKKSCTWWGELKERDKWVLSALMVRNRLIRIWQPLEKQASRNPPLRDHCLLWKGQRSRGRWLSKAGKDEAHQLETHAATAMHQGNVPPEGCEAPVKEAPVEPTVSPFALSGPGRQTSTWIIETLTLTGNGSKKGTAEFRWGLECVRDSNSPRQFPLKCSCTRPINSNWKGTTTESYQVFEMFSL